MEKITRRLSKGTQVEYQVVTRVKVEFYLVLYTSLLTGVKSTLAVLVVLLDRGDISVMILVISGTIWIWSLLHNLWNGPKL